GDADGAGEVVLLDEQQQRRPEREAVTGRPAWDGLDGAGEALVDVVVVLRGDAALPDVVHGLHAVGRLADLLHGWELQADEHGDDGDDHQQLDQRKSATAPSSLHRCESSGNKCERRTTERIRSKYVRVRQRVCAARPIRASRGGVGACYLDSYFFF